MIVSLGTVDNDQLPFGPNHVENLTNSDQDVNGTNVVQVNKSINSRNYTLM